MPGRRAICAEVLAGGLEWKANVANVKWRLGWYGTRGANPVVDIDTLCLL